MKKLLFPILLGIFLPPLFTFFHECGHYFTARTFGVPARLGLGLGHISYADDPATRKIRPWITAAAIFVDAALAIGGYLWLRRQRANRKDSTPTFLDWLATSLTLRAVMFPALCIALLLGLPSAQAADEVSVSMQLGMPVWIAPCSLGLAGLLLVLGAIRLHPQGYRFLPFTCALIAILLGPLLLVVILSSSGIL